MKHLHLIRPLSVTFFLTATLAISTVFLSCRKSSTNNFEIEQVRAVVLVLDSAANSRQVTDSAEQIINSIVAEIMNYHDLGEAATEADATTVGRQRQQELEKARRTWEQFKQLCLDGQYEQALDFYLATSEDSVKINAGDLLTYLYNSKQRYILITRVISPLMRTYRGDSPAIVQLIDDLSLEKLFEDLTMEMHEGYVPEVYPSVIRTLGMAMTINGQIDEALEMANDMVNAVYLKSQNALIANMRTVQYRVELLQLVGDDESVLGEYQWIRSFLLENEEVYDAEELKMAIQQIDSEIEQLQCKLKN